MSTKDIHISNFILAADMLKQFISYFVASDNVSLSQLLDSICNNMLFLAYELLQNKIRRRSTVYVRRPARRAAAAADIWPARRRSLKPPTGIPHASTLDCWPVSSLKNQWSWSRGKWRTIPVTTNAFLPDLLKFFLSDSKAYIALFYLCIFNSRLKAYDTMTSDTTQHR